MAEELFTGWAPDAPVEDSLLRRFVFSMADRAAFLGDRLDRPELRTDALAAIDAGSPVVFDNYAVVLQPPAMFDVEAAVREAIDFFDSTKPFAIMSPWQLGDLAPLGLELMGHPPFMFRPAGPPPELRATNLRIEEVRSADDLAVFIETIVDAYPMPAGTDGAFDARMLDGPIRLYVGYEGDRPVATGGTVVGHGINDVEWISVRDECRGKAYGEAITWVSTVADPALPAALIASDLGFGVYRRLGYEPLMRFTLWFAEPS